MTIFSWRKKETAANLHFCFIGKSYERPPFYRFASTHTHPHPRIFIRFRRWVYFLFTDVENIVNDYRVKHLKNYLQEYYDAIKSSVMTRTEEFLCQVPDFDSSEKIFCYIWKKKKIRANGKFYKFTVGSERAKPQLQHVRHKISKQKLINSLQRGRNENERELITDRNLINSTYNLAKPCGNFHSL